jgi:hypothetical protein
MTEEIKDAVRALWAINDNLVDLNKECDGNREPMFSFSAPRLFVTVNDRKFLTVGKNTSLRGNSSFLSEAWSVFGLDAENVRQYPSIRHIKNHITASVKIDYAGWVFINLDQVSYVVQLDEKAWQPIIDEVSF